MPKFFDPDAKTHEEEVIHEPVHEENFSPKIAEAGVVENLATWEASSRPYRKKDRYYYTTIVILVILLCFIAFLAQEFLLIGVLFALTFVAYVLAFVPPNDITYKLSTQGIIIGDHFYFWHDLDSFWFKEKEGIQVLIIQTRLRFPGQLMLVLGTEELEKIKKIVAKFLPYHEIPQTSVLDRWSDSLQKHFPLENIHR